MAVNPFVKRNMKFGALVGFITGVLLSLALYARSGHPVVAVFVVFATLIGYCAPYLLYKVNED